MRIGRGRFAGGLFGLLLVAAAAAEPPATHWYRLELDGRPCGWVERTRIVEGPRTRAIERTRMAVAREGTELEVELALEWVEDAQGLLEVVRSHRSHGGAERREIATFSPESIQIRRREGEREWVDEIPRPSGEWLAPLAAAEVAQRRRAAGAAEIRLRMIALESGIDPVEVHALRDDEIGTFRWQGRDLPVSRWRSRRGDGSPIAEERFTSDGCLVERVVSTGVGRLREVLVTESEALAWRRGDLPEVLAASTVPLEAPFPADRGPILLRIAPRGDLDAAQRREVLVHLAALPQTRHQRVDLREDAVRVRLDRSGTAIDEAAPGAGALASSPMIDLDDALLQEVAQRLGGPEDLRPAERAERLRRGVDRFIARKDLSSALASASETVRSRRGDCSEHAVLLAALLRHHGIPAQVAVGLAPIEGPRRAPALGWHAWTRAWVDGGWIDLDATAADPREHRRVLVAVGDLAAAATDPLWSAPLPLLGRIGVAIEGPGMREIEESRR
jgi:transglutaminase-like putative cysteine protease